tara:strand:+ start:5625 stop:6122 length:498 start_codon:yes stop_codon:yes gene_type:complete
MKNYWMERHNEKKKKYKKRWKRFEFGAHSLGMGIESIGLGSKKPRSNSKVTIPGFVEEKDCKVLAMQHVSQDIWKTRNHPLENSRLKFDLSETNKETYELLVNLLKFIHAADEDKSSVEMKLQWYKPWLHHTKTFYEYKGLSDVSFTLRDNMILLHTRWDKWEVK